MTVKVLKSVVSKSREYDYNEFGETAHINFVKIFYHFITKNGFKGFIESPNFQFWNVMWNNSLRAHMSSHEELIINEGNERDARMYFNILRPEPYKIVSSWDENDSDKYYYREKEFYEPLYVTGNYLSVDFDDVIVIETNEHPSIKNEVWPKDRLLIIPKSINYVEHIEAYWEDYL